MIAPASQAPPQAPSHREELGPQSLAQRIAQALAKKGGEPNRDETLVPVTRSTASFKVLRPRISFASKPNACSRQTARKAARLAAPIPREALSWPVDSHSWSSVKCGYEFAGFEPSPTSFSPRARNDRRSRNRVEPQPWKITGNREAETRKRTLRSGRYWARIRRARPDHGSRRPFR